MIFVGQTVEHRNAGIFCQCFDNFLSVAAVFDPVEHASQNARRVGDAFFFADLRRLRIEINGVHAEIRRGDFKGTAGAGAGLFKDQRDVFALAKAVRDSRFFLRLQFCGKVEIRGDFRGRKIQKFQKVFRAFHNGSFPMAVN